MEHLASLRRRSGEEAAAAERNDVADGRIDHERPGIAHHGLGEAEEPAQRQGVAHRHARQASDDALLPRHGRQVVVADLLQPALLPLRLRSAGQALHVDADAFPHAGPGGADRLAEALGRLAHGLAGRGRLLAEGGADLAELRPHPAAEGDDAVPQLRIGHLVPQPGRRILELVEHAAAAEETRARGSGGGEEGRVEGVGLLLLVVAVVVEVERHKKVVLLCFDAPFLEGLG
mmetsp:Transcript_33991/g.100166  ORF Transcript_33991/g.100166 Transcript_33991/m.100166 type:complete len:232 (+) Transcript_33991:359-1054(+)